MSLCPKCGTKQNHGSALVIDEYARHLSAERALVEQLYEALNLELRCHFMCDVCNAAAEGRDREYSHPYAMHADYDPKTIAHRDGCPVAAAIAAYGAQR